MTAPAQPTETPTIDTATIERLEDMYEVILHNDDHNTMDHVVRSLVRVFGHTVTLAEKIMRDAHRLGSAVAEVEAETEAKLHRDQLQSYGLSATVEKI
jgi:ATP-dependent Clp protease adaptor protein ClpS